MRSRIASVFLLLGVAGCAMPGAAPLPPDMRPNLDPKWVSPTGGIRWPEHQGFAEKPVPVVLPPGMLIDRFGLDSGTFFSPKGAAYSGRALPYVWICVPTPLSRWSGRYWCGPGRRHRGSTNRAERRSS